MAHVRRDRVDRADPAGKRLTPRIALLTTGGTIAAGAPSRDATTGYTLDGAGPADALLDAVPELRALAEIVHVPVCRIASPDMTGGLMLDLARQVSAMLARDTVDGAVIAHGTDTLEETAWLLHLTVRSDKPIVVTGAMRPGTALSADGPMNLLAAVAVAGSAEARGRGALVVLNDRIHSARLVRKAHATAPDAFRGGEIGIATPGAVRFLGRADGRHTLRSEFDATAMRDLPPVVLLPGYAELPPGLLHAVQQSGAAGLVLACTGNGSVPTGLRPHVEALIASGVTVVRSSRTLDGAVTWADLPGLMGGIHAPPKARILLALALGQTRDPALIQAMFREY